MYSSVVRFKTTMMKRNVNFVLFIFRNISTQYLPCNVSGQSSKGKFDYLDYKFRIRLAAITLFKNGDCTKESINELQSFHSQFTEKGWRLF